MALTKRKIAFLFVSLIFAYGFYTFFLETDIYHITYPKKDEWNYDSFNVYHSESDKRFVISNPPKEKLDVVNYLIENMSKWRKYQDSETTSFSFYEEKSYLNRYFTTLSLDGVTIYEAIKYHNPEDLKNDMEPIGISLDKYQNPYFSFGVGPNPYLVYFPRRNPTNSVLHWFLKYWHYLPNGKGVFEKFIPASYEFPDSLKNKKYEDRYTDWVIPKELIEPKNKDKWKWILRK
jgi:hypothetical protein